MSVRHRRYVQCDGAPTLGSRKSATPLSEVVTLKIHLNNKAKELDFQVVETTKIHKRYTKITKPKSWISTLSKQ